MLTINGIRTATTEEIPRTQLTQTQLATYTIPMHQIKTWDNRAVNLPAAAANDDMGLITGTFGTNVPVLQSEDFQGIALACKYCAFQFALPPEYDAGQTVTLRLRCAMITTVADDAATIDVECFESDRDGVAAGTPTDICTTGAQSMNSLTPADIDFTITPTALAPGDLLDIRLTFAGNDTVGAGASVSQISQIEMLCDIRG